MRFYEESDYLMIAEWMKDRGLKMCPQEDLPQIGVIVPGKAVAFLYQTDSSVCYIESLISNRKASDSDNALNLVVKGVLEAAKDLGYKTIFSSTKLDAVVNRAVELGFSKAEGYTFVAKELNR